MNTTIFWRLAWKEYRQQRDLLIAIALITLVILGIMLIWSWVENQALSPATLYHVALMMPVFYALGCGATLFAGEHERETFAFLRALPLRSPSAFWPKVAVALGSTLLLTIALLLLAALFSGGQFAMRQGDALNMVALSLLLTGQVMAEVLAWSMLASQLLKHPFWAIAAGGVAYFASLIVVTASLSLILPSQELQFMVLTIVRCVFLLLLVVANIAVGSKWLERERTIAASLVRPNVEEIAPAQGPATRWTMLSRLWWQSLRESGWIVAAIYGALTLLSLLVLRDEGMAGMVWGCLPALVGSFVFFQDHWKQQYRFFAEHGVSPRTLWWARILASLTICLPWLVVLLAAVATTQPRYSSGFLSDSLFNWPVDLLVLGIISFAWGQWCSLLFRAGVVGLFVGVAMSLFLLFAMAILRALGIPDWLGVYFPAAVLMWASWWCAPDWLAERNSWRRWFAYAATLAVPLLLYLGGIAAHRAYEIPQLVDNTTFVSGPGNVNIPAGIAAQHRAVLAELQRPATSEELETARLYRDLWNELRHLPPPNTGATSAMMGSAIGGAAGSAPLPEGGEAAAAGMSSASVGEPAPVDEEFEARLGEVVQRFVQVSQRPDADFFPAPFARPTPEESSIFFDVEKAVLHNARWLDDAGQSDQAQERYLALIRFARHYQQRGDSLGITTAVQSLGRVYEQLLSRAVRVKQPQESLLALIKTLNSAPYDFSPDYELAWMREYAWHRGLVELNPSAWEVVAEWPEAKTQRQLFAWFPWERTRTARWVDYQGVVGLDQSARAQASHWGGSTVGGWTIGFLRDPRGALDALLLKRQRAALELRLLLLAYKAEHGELPPSLSELEEEFPGPLPSDPTTQQPWVYRPQGVASDPELQRPYIWSPRISRFGVNPNGGTDPDLVQAGDVFVIEPGETAE